MKVTAEKIALYSLGFLFCILLLYKAVKMSMTHDEAATFLVYTKWSIYDIWTNSGPNPTANNHLLNTLLIKFLVQLFGDHQLVVRLSNILAGFSFLYFSGRLMQQVFEPKNKLLVLLGFSLLLMNNYQFDFFAVARGYGLSMGFFMPAIYFSLQAVANSSIRSWSWAVGLCLLAVLANFSSLVFCIALLGSALLLALKKERNWRFLGQILGIASLAALVLGLAIAPAIIRLIEFEQLYFGGDNGFFQDTIGSLARSYTHNISFLHSPKYIHWGFGFLLVFAAARLLFSLVKEKSQGPTLFIQLGLSCLLASCIGHLLLHLLFDVKFLMQRTALIYFPLLQFSLISLLYSLYQAFPLAKKWKNTALVFASVLGLSLFGLNYRPNTMTEWYYNVEDRKILSELEASIPQNETHTLGIWWLFFPTFEFYLETGVYQNIQLNPHNMQLDLEQDYDYYFIDHNAERVAALSEKYERFKNYQQGILFRHKNFPIQKNN
ncbi:hypothetical protein [Saprospira grandis]|uniref:hypothetical protein n=1 Tax=Saprospira grandis TaxID=1008 RepID=UPI0022DE581B|nr:hypothetical protein [Saprospira grandis]WBM75565.1 hypothetical protein OP864_04825 [Saprospira grandis]